MKLVILDAETYGRDINFDPICELGEAIIYQHSTADEVATRITDCDVVIVNKSLQDEKVLAKAVNLKLICIGATGTDNVDLAYCKEHSIAVTNVAGYSTNSVVQHTFAMLLYLLQHLPYYDDYVRSGSYETSPTFTHFGPPFTELYGKTWGIAGMGTIGRGVAKVARALGCKVIYYDLQPDDIDLDCQNVGFAELLQTSDILSLHLPLTPETMDLFNYDALCQMKPEAFLLNMSRGAIVNEADLAKLLLSDKLAGAGLDVLAKEPIEPDDPLFKAYQTGKLLITPHIAWASVEARTRLVEEVALNIKSWVEGTARNRVV